MIRLSKKLKNRMRIQKNKFFAGELAVEKEDRPELDKVHYHKDGHIVITNTFSAVQVADVHDGSLYHSDDNKDVDEDNPYPETNQLFEIPENFQSIVIPTEKLEKQTDDNEIRREMDILVFEITDKQLKITPMTKYEQTKLDPIILPIDSNVSNTITFKLSPRNFNDAMNFFRMTDIEEVTLLYEGINRPLHFISKNIHYVIAPMFSS